MPVRRHLFLAITFLGGALVLTSGQPARAQYPRGTVSSPGTHEIPGRALTPAEVKQALERLTGGDKLPPELLDQLKKKLGQDPKLDPQAVERLMKMLESNPQLQKQLMEEAKKRSGNGKAQPLPADFLKNFKNFPPPRTDPGGRPMPQPGDPVTPPRLDPAVVPKAPDGPALPPPMLGGNPPQVNPPPPPDIGPIPPGEPQPESPFDPNETPRDRAMRTFASLWERNVGPLDETPAVKRALFDLIEGTGDLKGADGKSLWDDLKGPDGKSFWDSLSQETGDATSLADFIDNASLGDSWKMPKLDFSLDWGRSDTDIGRGGSDRGSSGDSWWSRRGSSSSSRSGGSSGSGGFGSSIGLPGLEGPGLLVVILVIGLLLALLVWRFWDWKPTPEAAAALGVLGGWPIDPRRISTREHVVIAFEYLSVLICGPSARTWTHTTIAQALADLATTHGETAVMLARLYELARYAPLDEPLTAAEVAEARRLVCRLAGLEYE